MPRLVLASTSPRRKELLEMLQTPFTVCAPKADETIAGSISPSKIVMDLAVRKAKAGADLYRNPCVIGADTIVTVHGDILGKPSGKEHAVQMLKTLSGQTHSVFTGVAVFFEGTIETFYEKTDVKFWELSEKEIDRYI